MIIERTVDKSTTVLSTEPTLFESKPSTVANFFYTPIDDRDTQISPYKKGEIHNDEKLK